MYCTYVARSPLDAASDPVRRRADLLEPHRNTRILLLLMLLLLLHRQLGISLTLRHRVCTPIDHVNSTNSALHPSGVA